MKELSTYVKIAISLAIAYSFYPHDSSRQLPAFVSSPLTQLQQWFYDVIRPRMERNVIAVPEVFMTTPEIIANRGYPVEIHHVITDDGYILELHRIPFGKRDTHQHNSTFQRRAVFLQHGMMGTDHFWLVTSNNNSLAFLLADHGYDVWLGNSRGNTYARKHINLNPDKDEAFWDFSWDEMGQYDIPASLDYVLNVTGQEKLAAYFGYSLGCSVFFMSATQYPRINDQVDIMIGLGPTVSVAHLNNYFRYMAPFVNIYQLYQRLFGIGEVHTNDGVLHSLTRFICETSELGAKFGYLWLSQIFGYSDVFDQMDYYRLIGHYPAGGSANTMVHLLQNYNFGESFLKFDYGPERNLERYGTPYPPEYNLTLVTAPVFLVHADNDPFAPPQDVAWLKGKLGNLKGSLRVPSPTFSHGDFVWSPRVAELVHKPAIDLLPSPFIHKETYAHISA
ncbi:gastric triacylglycerol lipase-like [Daphnia carinata]|uniref:gastric triacylglycerol lipase-like n=1 Tax=Daphnia carinata TaxID=120202 RepID=UPI00257B064E|nr:gastric triacylglycerol lipase-like [Daphnia carinata]